MHRWFIQQNYAIKSALRRLYIQPFSSIANLLVITTILIVPLLSASILMSLKPITNKISVQTEITLFAKTDTPRQQISALSKDIETQYTDIVAKVKLVTKEQALQSLQELPAWNTAINTLNSNPLPDAIVVTLKDNINQSEVAKDLHDQWSNLQYIDKVQLDQQWVQRLSTLISFLQLGLITLSAGFAVVIISTVFNTVRMQALALQDEITVMRMVGATESFVKRPFLYLGAIIGLLSSVLAIVITKIIILSVGKHINSIGQLYDASINVQLPSTTYLIVALISVISLSAMAARWSVVKQK